MKAEDGAAHIVGIILPLGQSVGPLIGGERELVAREVAPFILAIQRDAEARMRNRCREEAIDTAHGCNDRIQGEIASGIANRICELKSEYSKAAEAFEKRMQGGSRE